MENKISNAKHSRSKNLEPIRKNSKIQKSKRFISNLSENETERDLNSK